MLDYALAVEKFDKQVGVLVGELKAAGEFDNTLVIVTSDNGMPFPPIPLEHACHREQATPAGVHGRGLLLHLVTQRLFHLDRLSYFFSPVASGTAVVLTRRLVTFPSNGSGTT